MATERIVTRDWTVLEENYPARLVEGVRNTLARADSQEIDPNLLGPSCGSNFAIAKRLLEELAKLGVVVVENVKLCGNCETRVSTDDEAAGTCPKCERRYQELDTPFKSKAIFKLPAGRRSRDVSWVVTAHGMNTDGPWQQDFSWLIANKLKYSAPVLILKYPIFRVMALFERTQRLLVTDLGKRLEAAIAHARQRGDQLNQVPDVVLHSYGTLLFSRLLLDPQFSSLRFGRVILAGSIIRPDYDWRQHIASGRIEHVVNHCGDKDKVVACAQFAIPGSGPSGRLGFTDNAVRNVNAAGLGHGTFFDIQPMQVNLTSGGAWDRFLRYPPETAAGEDDMPVLARWSPNPFAVIVRSLAKMLAVLGLGPLIWFALQLISAVRAIIFAR